MIMLKQQQLHSHITDFNESTLWKTKKNWSKTDKNLQKCHSFFQYCVKIMCTIGKMNQFQIAIVSLFRRKKRTDKCFISMRFIDKTWFSWYKALIRTWLNWMKLIYHAILSNSLKSLTLLNLSQKCVNQKWQLIRSKQHQEIVEIFFFLKSKSFFSREKNNLFPN